MNNILSDYFQLKLDSLGYPSGDVCFSLSSSQGDGVAMYGPIDEDGLLKISERLLSGHTKSAVNRAIKKGVRVELYRNALGHRYSHQNTMNINFETYYAEELTEFENTSLNAFISMIDDEIRKISASLESDGYYLINSGSQYGALKGVVRTYNTKRFSLIIEEVEDSSVNLSYMEPESRMELYTKLLSGDMRLCSLKVTVTNKLDMELAKDYIDGVFVDNVRTSRFYDGALRELVSDVVSDCRNFINSISLAA